jgi:cytochrome c biogenesis protein CcmG, thiol:disulfide interchange protein DsbE
VFKQKLHSLSETTITLVVLVVFLLIVAVFTVLSIVRSDMEETPPTPAERFLDSSGTSTAYTDIKGNALDLDKHLGKVVVATAWASWCAKCKTELIKLASLSEVYDVSEVVMLAVNRAEPRSTAERFLNTMPLAKPPLLILDADDRFYRSVEGYTMPETVVYSRDGEVLYHARGPFDSDLLKSQVSSALED